MANEIVGADNEGVFGNLKRHEWAQLGELINDYEQFVLISSVRQPGFGHVDRHLARFKAVISNDCAVKQDLLRRMAHVHLLLRVASEVAGILIARTRRANHWVRGKTVSLVKALLPLVPQAAWAYTPRLIPNQGLYQWLAAQT